MGDNGKSPGPSPRERYEDFARENEEWDRKVKEALDDLDELIEEKQPEDEAAPARRR
jgi:hypothetical protein